MPNGHDREWVRFCHTINGFRARYGTWPTTVRCDPVGLRAIRRQLLEPEVLAILEKHFRLIPDPTVTIVALDEAGQQFSLHDDHRADSDEEDIRQWLGIDSIPEALWHARLDAQHPPAWETGQFGRWLRAYLDDPERKERYDVFYDHGDRATDTYVVAIKGIVGESVSGMNRLADIDVMLATPELDARLLIEIEESALSPKKLLGDIFAILLCTGVAVRLNQQRYYRITPETRLIVAGIVPAGGQKRAQIEEVILPRLQLSSGPPGGPRIKNVSLVLGGSLEEMIEQLQAEVLDFLG